jgi:hypothetical protein
MINPRYAQITAGLDALIAEVRSIADNAPRKLEAMQEVYFERNLSNHSEEEQTLLRGRLQACNYKWFLSSLSLEQLWAMSDERRLQLTQGALQLAPDADPLAEDNLMLISFAYEGFLLQARSFLDYYMKYLCLFLEGRDINKISSTKFRKCMKTQNVRFPQKNEKVTDYFSSYVSNMLAKNEMAPSDSLKWGDLLISLRDRITHAKPLRYSFKSSEQLTGGVRFDWPTVQDATYDRSAQDISNGMFEMLKEIAEILYELPWQAGPYRSDLWNDIA